MTTIEQNATPLNKPAPPPHAHAGKQRPQHSIKTHARSHGIDTEEMSETAILSANTGSEVFLQANVRFADAMEDLTFQITM